MKFKYLAVLVFFVASAFGAARAQNVKGVVYGADTDEPLIGASVYWAGTTVGTGADAEGNYTIHRVKGYDMLVAGFVGYTSDTIRVESGVERVDFRLSNDGVELEEVVVNSTLGGNYVKRDGILKGEMISFAGLCKMACCNLAESFENSASVTVGYSDAISGARPGARREVVESYIKRLKEMEDIALSYPGVVKTYAIQAGRELRVIVGADKLSDQESEGLSHDIAKKIQDEMTYPGQVKITVIRETRAVSYAK